MAIPQARRMAVRRMAARILATVDCVSCLQRHGVTGVFSNAAAGFYRLRTLQAAVQNAGLTPITGSHLLHVLQP